MLNEVEPIEQGGVAVVARESLKDIVELPLLAACQELYDKNIQTSMTSANKKDIETGEAYITLVYDTLSDENKIVADSLAEMHEYRGKKYAKLIIPVTAQTTVAELGKRALEIASKFKKQPFTWAHPCTLEELRKIYGDQKGQLQVGDFTNYFYDADAKLFYASEEHFRKVKESGAV